MDQFDTKKFISEKKLTSGNMITSELKASKLFYTQYHGIYYQRNSADIRIEDVTWPN